MPKRHSNDPRRHILAQCRFREGDRDRLLRCARYRGSEDHKSAPLDYPLDEACTPKRNKTLCDLKRPITFREARELFAEGIRRGMVSKRMTGGYPVFVWSVDDHGEVYEAKPGGDPRVYHGYPLGPRDGVFPDLVRQEWRRRGRR